jgi:hypothetical protein
MEFSSVATNGKARRAKRLRRAEICTEIRVSVRVNYWQLIIEFM